ncbi:MAG: caspase family protein [Bacteroidales bacterium]|jgi:tetratricopeptide (TPR) repeat protein|nr:caspase family protein [Bacteroidales bacterium]
MKRGFSVLVILLVVTCLNVDGQTARKYIKAGEEFTRNGMLEDAIDQYSKAIDEDPSSADSYVRRARVYEMTGNIGLACDDYRRANSFLPDDTGILFNLGRMCNILGSTAGTKPDDRNRFYSEAVTHLQKAIRAEFRNGRLYTEKVVSLIGMELWDRALGASDTALQLRDDAINYYHQGIIYQKKGDDNTARRQLEKAVTKDKSYATARLELARVLIRQGDVNSALGQCNMVIQQDSKNVEAYLTRAMAYEAKLDYPAAINDVSTAILLEPAGMEHYITRGTYYQKFNQHLAAVSDFTKALAIDQFRTDVYLMRARSYEEIHDFEKAADDYSRVLAMKENGSSAKKMLSEANDRLFAINRESSSPEILLETPLITEKGEIEIGLDRKSLMVTGKVNDRSLLAELSINNIPVRYEGKGSIPFAAEVEIPSDETIRIVARDVYDNEKVLTYRIRRTEVDPPEIQILAPYILGQDILVIDSISTTIDIEGRVKDQNLIRSVKIENMSAQFSQDNLNPSFIAKGIDVRNSDKVTILVEDIYGNRTIRDYALNRNGTTISASNPMGNTLVVFIENSDYHNFAALQGPPKDASLISGVLEDDYQVLPVKRLRNQTKQQMEKFFSIDLRDEVRAKQIKSLVIWFAGHGKFINDVGYWIPVDARRDEEFTYFSLNTLRASMETYMNYLTHVLVITDACESGPSFYQAMRTELRPRNCADWRATQFKSSQIFSSAGYELAVDDSQFTRTFASTLRGNPNTCISIEEIVLHVTKAVAQNNQQKPRFGKITGLKDEDGTFFFVKK